MTTKNTGKWICSKAKECDSDCCHNKPHKLYDMWVGVKCNEVGSGGDRPDKCGKCIPVVLKQKREDLSWAISILTGEIKAMKQLPITMRSIWHKEVVLSFKQAIKILRDYSKRGKR